MVQNNVRAERSKLGWTQTRLADELPDNIDGVGVSFIENGRVLPTKDQLDKLCEIFHCEKLDLYDSADIDLLSEGTEGEIELEESTTPPVNRGRGHAGMVEFRAWLRPHEKEALEHAVNALGYRSCAEWMREMIRNTVARNRRLHVKA